MASSVRRRRAVLSSAGRSMAPRRPGARSHSRIPRRPSTEAHRALGALQSSLLASSPPVAKAKGADPKRASRDASNRATSSRNRGRNHLGMPSDIKSECRARSSRNRGRLPSESASKIAKLKDGRTHLAYKPEHAVDLDTGVIVAAALHPADNGDTTTIGGTLATAENNLAQIDAAPTPDNPSELVADKGYHSRAVLKDLNGGAWNTRIAEPKQPGFSRWHGDDKARAAVYANRTRLGSAVGKQAMRRRAEIVERSFAHNLDRGGMRRTWLRGRDNVHKRYLVHVAGHNLGILMRLLIGAGTPREAAARALAYAFFFYTEQPVTVVLVAACYNGFTVLVMAVADDPA